MFTDFIKAFSQIAKAYRTIMRISHLPPKVVEPQQNHVDLNVGTVVVATLLFLSARSAATLGSDELATGALIQLMLSIVAIVFILLSSTAIVILDPGSDSEQRADQWTSAMLFVWIFSLAILILDYISHIAFSWSLIIGYATDPWQPSLAYSLIATTVLALRSKFLFGQAVVRFDFATSFLLVISFNFLLMYVLVYFRWK